MLSQAFYLHKGANDVTAACLWLIQLIIVKLLQVMFTFMFNCCDTIAFISSRVHNLKN